MKRTIVPFGAGLAVLAFAVPFLMPEKIPALPAMATVSSIATESDLATGLDLKGPPKVFIGSETPE